MNVSLKALPSRSLTQMIIWARCPSANEPEIRAGLQQHRISLVKGLDLRSLSLRAFARSSPF